MASVALEKMRMAAKIITYPLARVGLLRKPFAVAFGMLSANGAGLLYDAIPKLAHHVDLSTLSQAVSGLTITVGCGLFAAADIAKGQNTTNIMVQTAPRVLTGAIISNIAMAAATRNGYMIAAVISFSISNFAGFFTKIEKASTSGPNIPSETRSANHSVDVTP